MTTDHNDLLDMQMPMEEEEQDKYADLCKERATGCFKSGDMASAEKLYTRALEARPKNAILLSNRALVRTNLDLLDAGLKDAKDSIAIDSSYSKAHYRYVQILIKMKKFTDAQEAASSFKTTGGDVSVMKPLEAEINSGLEREREDRLRAEKAKIDKPITRKADPPPKPAVSPRKPSPDAEATKNKTKDNSNMKGYKMNAAGQKTSYFHTDLSEEAKAMLPCSRPQKLSSNATAPLAQPSSTTTAAKQAPLATASSWNENTFETKDCTSWAKERIAEVFPITLPLDTNKCQIKSESVSGDLTACVTRGQMRVINDLTFKFKWELMNDHSKKLGDGTLTFEADGAGGYTIDHETKESQPDGQAIIRNNINKDDSVIKRGINNRLDELIREFQASLNV